MELIVTHASTDFDALASQVAASRLYPGATRVVCRRLGHSVRAFLSLHKDCFPMVPASAVDLDAVTRVIAVDVRRAGRLQDVAPLVRRLRDGDPALDLHVYDHHDDAPDDLRGSLEHVELVGATTTLLTELIDARGLAVTPIEATLMALGIHADTGSLTFPNTTPRDARALAWALAHGASIKMMRRYLRMPLDATQREIMAHLLAETEEVEVNALAIGVACVAVPRSISSVAEVVRQVLDLEGYDALFALLHHGDRVNVIGRSRVPYLDVGDVLQALGGGGHKGAGAATSRGLEVAEVRARLLATLRASPPRVRRVRQAMTTPARTLSPDVPFEVAGPRLEAWGGHGAPVMREGALVGLVTRGDVQAALAAGDGGLPVSARMAQHVITAHPDERVEAALERMVVEDVGLLPVVEEGRVIGVLTRTDLRRLLYPDGTAAGAVEPTPSEPAPEPEPEPAAAGRARID